MPFNREALPDPIAYFENQGLALRGPGLWKTTRCDFHGASDKMRVNTASGGWKCMVCGTHGGDVLAHLMQSTGLDFIAAAKQLGAWVDDGQQQSHRGQQAHHQPVPRIYHPPTTPPQNTTLNAAGWAQWRATHLITPDTPDAPAFNYLVARNGMIPPLDGHLRWLPAHRHPSGYVGPCLVALLTDVVTREAKSLHFTWIQPDGQKAAVKPPRLLLKGHVKAGTVCRLWPDSDVTYGLAIAEGIETALSLAHAYRPAWACVDAGNLSAFPVLPGVESLLIACDRDPAGEKAAAACASRWADEGREVLVTRQSCNDLNDLVQIAATECEVTR